jgi:putative ATP-binding cassette transporter
LRCRRIEGINMDWNHQLLASLAWLGEAFVLSVLGMSVAVLALGRFTVWGRQFFRISGDYFNPARSVLPLAWLALVVLMTLFAVRMDVLLSMWNNGFYNSLQQLDAPAFWSLLLVFAVLALVYVTRALLVYYLRQAFLIHWRVWLTQAMLARWLDGQAYYRSQYVPGNDNPDQRIQQDIDSFVNDSLSLSMGLLDSIVSLIAFSIILWTLSGVLTVFGHPIPRAMILMVYLYTIVATVFALKLGRPLIRLSFFNERFNADFRYALIRLREYGESIAFYRGETVERNNLLARFGAVIGNTWGIVFRSLKFQGFNLAVSQATTVFPVLVQAPRLFAKQITLGDVTQTAQAFSQVESSLSFFRNAYDTFAGYRAVLERLAGFLDAIDRAGTLGGARIEAAEQGLIVSSLSVSNPSGTVLVQDLALELAPGAALLIRGSSGIGKTTLLRAIAGLWPYASGKVSGPAAPRTLFLPQKPYLPLGTLRQALHYPAAVPAELCDAPAAGDADAALLQQCQLGHLAARLDQTDDWTRILSLGEQQRLAIGRVLLNRPALVFLDEASSAMDEGLEYAMYRLLRSALPEAILVSVGHRGSLLGLHEQELELSGQGKWRLRVTGNQRQTLVAR